MHRLFGLLKSIVAIAATLGGVYLFYLAIYKAPCDTPLTYKIGTFDTKFGISKEDFIATLSQAEDIWEKPIGKNLLEYNPKGEVTVNLVYDDRQALTDKNKVLSSQIEQTKQSADTVQLQFQNMKAIFNQKNDEFKNLQTSFTKELDSYNQSVAYWNTKGGAPESEYKKLVAEKNNLALLRSKLEQKYHEANDVADQLNTLIDKYNLLVNYVNTDVATVNSSAGQEFSEGEYIYDKNGERINVYQFENKEKLRRVLAHEFGHALSLNHNDNPKSIMYKVNQSTNSIPTIEDMAGLKTACKLQ